MNIREQLVKKYARFTEGQYDLVEGSDAPASSELVRVIKAVCNETCPYSGVK